MDQSKIDMFLATNGKKFNPVHLQQITQLLSKVNETQFQQLLSLDLKDPSTLLIVSLLAGGLGVDRFMLGDTKMGVIKLLTGGGCMILTIMDWFSIQDKTKEYNFQLLMQAIA